MRKTWLPAAGVLFFLVMALLSPLGAAGPTQPVEEELSWLSLQEDQVFQELFALSMTLANLEGEKERLAAEAEAMREELGRLDDEIRAQESRHERTVAGLAGALRSYQRLGPASYLEILLQARDLGDFWRRLNLLRDLAQGTQKLLRSIEESRAALVAEKEKYEEKLAALAAKEAEVAQAQAQAHAVRQKLEAQLRSLAEERAYYQDQLSQMQQTWEELKPFFAQTLEDLADRIDWSKMPRDALKTRLSLRGVYGTLTEDTVNDIIRGYPELAGVSFRFTPGEAFLVLPESRLVLEGTFVIVQDTAIMFQVKGGTFYGFPLAPETIGELLPEGRITMDFQPLIGGSVLRSVAIRDKEVELLIIPAFWSN
ncbi:MAG TPA: hypothetical protein GX504_10615 [Clostridia bacterium]|nr:hypothetical protein [Clostridia bacterium]